MDTREQYAKILEKRDTRDDIPTLFFLFYGRCINEKLKNFLAIEAQKTDDPIVVTNRTIVTECLAESVSNLPIDLLQQFDASVMDKIMLEMQESIKKIDGVQCLEVQALDSGRTFSFFPGGGTLLHVPIKIWLIERVYEIPIVSLGGMSI